MQALSCRTTNRAQASASGKRPPASDEARNPNPQTLAFRFVISPAEHAEKYEARPTKVKLGTLTREKGLPEALHESVWERKQKFTAELIELAFRPVPEQQV